jgi:ABC-type branched-subunit amino acid transport system permease subunit
MSATPATGRRMGNRLGPIRGVLGQHQSLTVLLGMVVVGILLPIISIVPPFNSFGTQKDFIGSFADAGVFVLLALGLNVVVGFAGLLDLGYAAFFAIGAYTMAYGASGYSGLDIPFWIMLWVGLIVAALFGLLLGAPTLRLRGDYLAIVTLGFGEIVPVVFLNADSYTNGTNGITGIAQPSLYGLFGINGFGFTDPLPYYVTMLLIVTLAMVLLYRLQDSRLGRAWVALREDELAAASMGINTVSTKLLAFAIGASTAGFAGVFYSAKLASVTPQEFDFTVSFTALAMVVLGGMGNIWGVAVGAFIIYLLQHQALKQLTNAVHSAGLLQSIDFTNYQYLLYGLALVGMMLLRPEGLFPSRRRRQELHAATADVEATAVDAVSEA